MERIRLLYYRVHCASGLHCRIFGKDYTLLINAQRFLVSQTLERLPFVTYYMAKSGRELPGLS